MYSKIINKSWKDLFDNGQVFIPDLLFVIVTFILGIITLYMSGVAGEVISLFKLINSESGSAFALMGIGQVLADNILRVILSMLFFVFTTFFIGAGFEAVRYGMFRDLLAKKKINFIKSFVRLNKEFYWKLILMRIFVFLIFLAGLAAVGLVFGLLSVASVALGFVAGVLLLIVLFIYFLLMLFFVVPIVFTEKKKLTQSFKMSFKYSKKYLGHVVLSLLILIGIMILVSIAVNIILIPFQTLILVNLVLSSLLYLIPSVWSKYFVFVAYKSK